MSSQPAPAGNTGTDKYLCAAFISCLHSVCVLCVCVVYCAAICLKRVWV